MAKKRKLRPVSETRAVNDKVKASADHVGRMPKAQRVDAIAEYTRRMEEHAPSKEAADSDLLAILQAVGLEFTNRYYPDSEQATFTISRCTPAGSPWYWVSIPIVRPAKGGV